MSMTESDSEQQRLRELKRASVERFGSILSRTLAAIEDHPWTGGGDLFWDGTLEFPINDVLYEAWRRLCHPMPLDEVEVSPARHSDPSTSKAAALTITPNTAYGKLASTFYYRDEYETMNPGSTYVKQHGLTAEQAVELSDLGGKSPWKRCSELNKAGIIAPTGETIAGKSGRQQQLLAITEHGKREVERLLLGGGS